MAPLIPFNPWPVVSIKNLPREFQLHLGRECLVKFLHVRIVHIVTLGRLVHAGDIVQIAGDELFAEEERIVRAFRQIVIADAEVPGIRKAAVTVKANVALEY